MSEVRCRPDRSRVTSLCAEMPAEPGLNSPLPGPRQFAVLPAGEQKQEDDVRSASGSEHEEEEEEQETGAGEADPDGPHVDESEDEGEGPERGEGR
jgi:hypothetical protein